MSRKATLTFLACLLPWLAIGQACTGCDGNRPQFSNNSNEQASRAAGGGGDGEPLDNKPAPGTYYRVVPGLICHDQPSFAGIAEVSATSIQLKNLDSSTCRYDQKTLSFADVQHSSLNPTLLGTNGGVYIRSDEAPQPDHPKLPLPEALCRLRDASQPSLDVTITYDFSSRSLSATLAGAVSSGGSSNVLPTQTLSVGRDLLSSGNLYSSSGGFKLTVSRGAAGAAKVAGHLSTTYAGHAFDANLDCFVGSIYDVVSPVRPTLAMDFSGGLLPASLTFSRVGTATYFDATGNLVVSPSGLPRFDHHPVTKAPLGILLEETRTNLLAKSTDLSISSTWYANGPNSIETPKDGTWLGLDRFRVTRTTPSSSNIWDRPCQDVNITAGVNYTISFFAQPGSVNSGRLFIWLSAGNETNVDFDLTNGSAVVIRQNVITTVSTFSQPVPGGYRVAVTFTSTQSGTINVGLGPISPTQGDYIYVTGAQLEQGSGATSFILTTDSPVTRGEDVLTMSDVSWYQSLSGTLGIDLSRPGFEAAGASALPQAISLSNGSGDESSIYFNPALNPAAYLSRVKTAGAGGDTVLSGPSSPAPSQIQKLFLAYAPSNSVGAWNGVLTTIPDRTGLAPTRLDLGGITGSKWNGHLKAFTYWPQRLDNRVLQAFSP